MSHVCIMCFAEVHFPLCISGIPIEGLWHHVHATERIQFQCKVSTCTYTCTCACMYIHVYKHCSYMYVPLIKLIIWMLGFPTHQPNQPFIIVSFTLAIVGGKSEQALHLFIQRKFVLGTNGLGRPRNSIMRAQLQPSRPYGGQERGSLPCIIRGVASCLTLVWLKSFKLEKKNDAYMHTLFISYFSYNAVRVIV